MPRCSKRMLRGPNRGALWALCAAACTAWAVAPAALAGEADIVSAEASAMGEGLFSFSVTVRHADEGWDHYADGYEIVAPDGTVLGTRVLAHPHVDEQPFTRSLSGVAIPDGITSVTVRAHDSVHGLGGQSVEVTLPR